jgi:hypothetical protein
MIEPKWIHAHMPVVCSSGYPFAIVDRTVDDREWLRVRAKGMTRFIPLGWVRKIDDSVHLDRSAKEAMHEWSTATAQSPLLRR